MNIRNKFILLMAMSLLLLISIGSVCAIEDNVDNIDAQIEASTPDTTSIDDISEEEVSSQDNNIQSATLGNSQEPVLSKNDTEIISEDTQKGDGETLEIDVKVKSDETEISVDSGDIEVYNDNKKLNTQYEDSTVTIKDKLNIGVYNLTIKYKGNDSYNPANKTITLSVYGIDTVKSININSTKRGEVKLNITDGKTRYDYTASDLDTILTYKDGNTTKTMELQDLEVNDGNITFSLDNLNFTTATLTISYKGVSTANITVNRIYNVDVLIVNDKNEYKVGTFTFKVVDIDDNNKTLPNAEVSLTTLGNIRAGFSAKTDEEGIASFKTESLYIFTDGASLTMKTLPAGVHTMELGTKNNVKFKTKNINLTVTKANVKITVSNYNEIYGSDKDVIITATKSDGTPLTNEVIYLYMPQTSGKNYYFATNGSGQCKINVKNLIPGVYSYKVAANNTASIKLNPVTGDITIRKAPVQLTVCTPSVYYNTDNTATILVKYKDGSRVPNAILKVQLYQGEKLYKVFRVQADSKGSASFKATLPVGKNKIRAIIAEEQYEPRYSSGWSQAYLNVFAATGAKVVAPSLNAYYKDGQTFNVQVVNTKKNNMGMHDIKVNIKVYITSDKYYSYSGSTDANGFIRLSLSNYNPGTYKVEITPENNNNYKCNPATSQISIQKAPAKITVDKVTAKKGEKKYITIQVINTKTNKPLIGAPVKVKIMTGDSSTVYSLTTNSEGKAFVYVDKLSVGTHKVIASAASNYYSATTATNYVTITK